MSTDRNPHRDAPGGKMAADQAVGESKRLLEEAVVEEQQMSLLDPLTAEETAEAQEELGPLAGPLTVVRHAREKRKGRQLGSKNRRTNDFERYISQFGPDPAVVLTQITGESEEAMVARSRALDPAKRQLTWGEARAMRIRAAEAMLPYRHGKKPVTVDATIRGVIVNEQIGEMREARGATIDGIARVLPPEDWEGRDES